MLNYCFKYSFVKNYEPFLYQAFLLPSNWPPSPQGQFCFLQNWPEGGLHWALGIRVSSFCLYKLCMLQQEHLHLIIFTLIIFAPASLPPPPHTQTNTHHHPHRHHHINPPNPPSSTPPPPPPTHTHTHRHTHFNLQSSTGSSWQGRVRVKQSLGLSFCLFVCGASVTDLIISVLPFHFLSCFFLSFHPNINYWSRPEQNQYLKTFFFFFFDK